MSDTGEISKSATGPDIVVGHATGGMTEPVVPLRDYVTARLDGLESEYAARLDALTREHEARLHALNELITRADVNRPHRQRRSRKRSWPAPTRLNGAWMP